MTRFRSIIKLLTLALAVALFTMPAHAQKTDRDSAIVLYNTGKRAEAAAMFEEIVKAGTADKTVYEMLGYYVLANSASLSDPKKRKSERARARVFFDKAVSLGSRSEQTRALADGIPKDGGEDGRYSGNRDVDALMRIAETAYAVQDYKTARDNYYKILAVEADNYKAALYVGDTYWRSTSVDSAYFWFAHAAEINPNQETAYRWWSGLLLDNLRYNQARDQAVEAVVAEPYNLVAHVSLTAWAKKTSTEIAVPRVELKNDAKRAYDSVRKVWKGDGGKKPGQPFVSAYPAELTYRHSLAEEHAALTAALGVGGDDPGAQLLKKLSDTETLDAHVLVAMTDAGIAKDYPNYRRNHRSELRKFWLEFVIGAPYGKK
jgi:tetratricopeptide (TPR) repeat protein